LEVIDAEHPEALERVTSGRRTREEEALQIAKANAPNVQAHAFNE
jgi:hypothetical protein